MEKERKGRGNADKNAGVMDDLSMTRKGGGERDNREEGIHCKKRFAIFPSPAGMSLIKLSLDGNN